jgi:hypothetical protein
MSSFLELLKEIAPHVLSGVVALLAVAALEKYFTFYSEHWTIASLAKKVLEYVGNINPPRKEQ